ncbi:TetR/AcrR family transcriptional regulator [Tenacibaculum sp. C7A-26P2]|uniref:TetR/AcrR family transcriptional regulator n=1 Tax=Tenacibaculum sp. C7A-26P2 TaxID=3447504 RepID=UPI003F8523D2
MKGLLSNIKIFIPEGTYIKDPESSNLGKRIIENSIVIIEKIGFENFNFKKLGKEIGSNESSIYRYFESKHELLIYLTSWYWGWIEYQLVLETYSINDSKNKLIRAIDVVTRKTKQDNNYGHINEVILNKIIIHENSKCYLTKEVDNENKVGYFKAYKRVIKRLAEIISLYDKSYKYALSLAGTITESALHQHYMKLHFPSVTSCSELLSPTEFLTNLTLNTLRNGK